MQTPKKKKRLGCLKILLVSGICGIVIVSISVCIAGWNFANKPPTPTITPVLSSSDFSKGV